MFKKDKRNKNEVKQHQWFLLKLYYFPLYQTQIKQCSSVRSDESLPRVSLQRRITLKKIRYEKMYVCFYKDFVGSY